MSRERDDAPEIPLVCFDKDICRILGISRQTLYRLLNAKVFPIPTLPTLDRYRRWSRDDVRAFLDRRTPMTARRAS